MCNTTSSIIDFTHSVHYLKRKRLSNIAVDFENITTIISSVIKNEHHSFTR